MPLCSRAGRAWRPRSTASASSPAEVDDVQAGALQAAHQRRRPAPGPTAGRRGPPPRPSRRRRTASLPKARPRCSAKASSIVLADDAADVVGLEDGWVDLHAHGVLRVAGGGIVGSGLPQRRRSRRHHRRLSPSPPSIQPSRPAGPASTRLPTLPPMHLDRALLRAPPGSPGSAATTAAGAGPYWLQWVWTLLFGAPSPCPSRCWQCSLGARRRTGSNPPRGRTGTAAT
jgi:hypothetical protein